MSKRYTQTETVGIKILRDQLSSYINKTKLGIKILVSDRGQIVAQMRAADSTTDLEDSTLHPLARKWVENKTLSLGKRKRTKVLPPGKLSGKTTILELLDAERGER